MSIPIIPPNTNATDLINTINDRIKRINLALGGSGSETSPTATISFGTHRQRLGQPVNGFAGGSLWVETDRNNVAYQIQNNAWAYSSGVMRATFASRPQDLGKADAGFLWSVTDYSHLLRWTGTGWEFCDDQGGYIAGRTVAPDANGWYLCDGTATTYLHIASGVVSEQAFTTPNLAGSPAYLKMAGGYTGVIVAAVAPPTLGPIGTAVGASGGSTASSNSHTHNTSLAGGDPVANLALLPYFRR